MAIKDIDSKYRKLTFNNDIAPRGELNISPSRISSPNAANVDVPAADSPEPGKPGLLWPGQEVQVAELTVNTAVVKSARRIKPGTRTDLQLLDQRRILSGAIDRCRVSRLEPLCYEAVFVFDQSAELPEANHV